MSFHVNILNSIVLFNKLKFIALIGFISYFGIASASDSTSFRRELKELENSVFSNYNNDLNQNNNIDDNQYNLSDRVNYYKNLLKLIIERDEINRKLKNLADKKSNENAASSSKFVIKKRFQILFFKNHFLFNQFFLFL
jgi:hypothetical protein